MCKLINFSFNIYQQDALLGLIPDMSIFNLSVQKAISCLRLFNLYTNVYFD